jgi:integrase
MKLSAPTISIFRRGGPKGVFYAQVNRTTPFSLGTRDPKEAELWKQGKLADLRRSMLGISQHYAVEVEPLTFDEAWTAYVGLRSVQKKAAPTRVGEEITYRLFTEWCRLRGLSLFESVTPALIKEYRRYLQSRPRRGGGLLDDTSVNNYVRDAGVVWKYLTAEEIYNGENPFKSVPKLAVAEKASKARNWEEVKYVIEASSRIDQDAHLVFVLGLYLGIRRSEILRARWEHIDWDANQITIHKTKPTVMTYTVNLYPDVRDALFAYRRDQGYIVKPGNTSRLTGRYRWEYRSKMVSVFKQINKDRSDDCKIAPFSSHKLRHTLITHLRGLGWELKDIAAFVCQSETSVTEKYGKAGPDIRRETLVIDVNKRLS